MSAQQAPSAASSPTKQLVLQALHDCPAPMSASAVADAVGVSRATAQRYLARLATSNDGQVRLTR